MLKLSNGWKRGSATIPILFGWLLDHQLARWVYIIVIVAMLLSMLTVVNMRPRREPAMAAAD